VLYRPYWLRWRADRPEKGLDGHWSNYVPKNERD
jgi:hypothetical protein